jgi:hypothetical protein
MAVANIGRVAQAALNPKTLQMLDNCPIYRIRPIRARELCRCNSTEQDQY